MCDFCTQHGEGRTWYLNAKNYSSELLNELTRKRFIGQFFHEVVGKGNRTISRFEAPLLARIGLPKAMRNKLTRDMQETHFGQVLPIEEVDKILAMARTIVRMACGCRWAKEKKESRLCFGISLEDPAWHDFLDMDYFGSPDLARLETMSRAEASAAMREADDLGYAHSVWTFHTPFIGGLCNCEQSYCLSMRSTIGLRAPSMFRAEFLAAIDADACQGCGACVEKCQFSAIDSDETAKKCRIDREKCYGCGVCRSACPANAITLSERRLDPIARRLWL